MRLATYTKQETISRLEEATTKYKTISELLQNEPKTYYYMQKYGLRDQYKKEFLHQRVSTQQFICKTILEKLLNLKCTYNSRSILSNKTELDIFFKEYNIACEYNGFYWHSKISDRDIKKEKDCSSQNILLILVREPSLNAYKTFRESVEGIKCQIIKYLDKINKKAGTNITHQDVENLSIDEKKFTAELYNKQDIVNAINNTTKYSEFRKKHSKIYQFLEKKKLLYMLDTIKNKDYIHMNNQDLVNHITSRFKTYTEFTKHKIYQVARLRKVLVDVKNYYKS